jgi:hypothetical protein
VYLRTLNELKKSLIINWLTLPAASTHVLLLPLQYLDPYREQREASKKRSAFLKRMLGKK